MRDDRTNKIGKGDERLVDHVLDRWSTAAKSAPKDAEALAKRVVQQASEERKKRMKLTGVLDAQA